VRYVYRSGGAALGWKVLTVTGAIFTGQGLISTIAGAAWIGSSISLERTLGTTLVFVGALSLVAGAATLIPGAVGWANAPGPSLRESTESLALDAARARRVALVGGAGDPLRFAPLASLGALSFAF
jgi:hypothetical protein